MPAAENDGRGECAGVDVFVYNFWNEERNQWAMNPAEDRDTKFRLTWKRERALKVVVSR